MHESEWKTRKTRIDQQLRALSPAWEIIPYKPGLDTSALSCHAVEEYPTRSGPADYALFVNGNLLGILEAKKVGIDPRNVLEQAKRYSVGCEPTIGKWDSHKVPFLMRTVNKTPWSPQKSVSIQSLPIFRQPTHLIPNKWNGWSIFGSI